jgi:ectoine hydroxylase-related dioxygenase (phytanoyl-CoA dioxygenase family)
VKLLDTTQIETFHRQGILRLSDLHPKSRMKSVREKIVNELSRLGFRSDGNKRAVSLQGLTPFQQIAKLVSLVKVDVHELLCTPDVLATVSAVAGQHACAEQGTQLLLSPGHQGRWSLDGLSWHVDAAFQPSNRIPGIQAFYLLDGVAPQGGATLALARSHRMQPEALRRLRAVLRQSTGMRLALQEFDIEVVEMSGRAGDIYLMDMRVLHTPSVNSTSKIRMMATTRFGIPGAVTPPEKDY